MLVPAAGREAQVRPRRRQRGHVRAGRGADQALRRARVDAGPAEPGQHPELPRDGALAAAGEHDRRAAAHATADPIVNGRTTGGMPCQLALRRLLDAQGAVRDQLERAPVAAAAAREGGPWSLEPILPAPPPLRVRPQVLDEQQPPARPQHAGDLAQGQRLVRDRAEHERRDDRVERVVGEGQRLGRRPVNLRRATQPLDAPLERACHRLDRLGEHERLDRVRVVAQVEAGPGADLEHATFGMSEQVAPVPSHAEPLAEPEERVVDPSEDAIPDAWCANS